MKLCLLIPIRLLLEQGIADPGGTAVVVEVAMEVIANIDQALTSPGEVPEALHTFTNSMLTKALCTIIPILKRKKQASQ